MFSPPQFGQLPNTQSASAADLVSQPLEITHLPLALSESSHKRLRIRVRVRVRSGPRIHSGPEVGGESLRASQSRVVQAQRDRRS